MRLSLEIHLLYLTLPEFNPTTIPYIFRVLSFIFIHVALTTAQIKRNINCLLVSKLADQRRAQYRRRHAPRRGQQVAAECVARCAACPRRKHRSRAARGGGASSTSHSLPAAAGGRVTVALANAASGSS